MGGSAKTLAPRDLQRLVAHVGCGGASARNTCVVLLSFRAGLRAAEVAGLDWSMVLGADAKLSDTLSISAAIAKNGRRRTVPMHPELKVALRRLHGAHGKPVQGAVVRSQRGGNMTAKSVVNWFIKTYAELGFDGCSSHSGRRTFITQAARLLSKSGGSLRDVQELAGHRALTTTERYIEGDRDAQRRLVRLML